MRLSPLPAIASLAEVQVSVQEHRRKLALAAVGALAASANRGGEGLVMRHMSGRHLIAHEALVAVMVIRRCALPLQCLAGRGVASSLPAHRHGGNSPVTCSSPTRCNHVRCASRMTTRGGRACRRALARAQPVPALRMRNHAVARLC